MNFEEWMKDFEESKEFANLNFTWLDMARTAYNAGVAAKSWQPIETAPKDGKSFVGANFRNKPAFIAIMWWDVIHKRMFKYTGGEYVHINNLTHWIPLPDPPESEANNG